MSFNVTLFLLYSPVQKNYVRSEMRISLFKANRDESCIKAQLAPSWSTRNYISCVTECKHRFRDRCRNLFYNTHTLTCTPVHPMARDQPTLRAQPGEVLYSQTHGQFLECDTARGFVLAQTCGAAACVWSSVWGGTYSYAKADCEQKNAILFMPNTYERFALLEFITSRGTWVGLIKAGATFKWQNGESVDPAFAQFMWTAGQPGNVDNGEDCGVYWRNGYFAVSKFHDMSCFASFRYICEQNY